MEETLKKVGNKGPTIHFKLDTDGVDNVFGNQYLGCTKCTGCVPNVHGVCTKCRKPLYTVDNSTVDNKEDGAKKSPRKKVGKKIIKKKPITITESSQLKELFDLFEPINPAYGDLFKNITERKALDWLCVKYGFEKVKNTIMVLPQSNISPFAPTITSPYELKMKLGKLIAWKNKQNSQEEEKEIAGLADKI